MRTPSLRLVLGLIAAVLTCFVLVPTVLREARLDLHHTTTEATVTTADDLRSGQHVEVSFAAAGQVRTGGWSTTTSHDVTVGEHLRIDYSPSHPSLVRRTGSTELPTILLVALLVMGTGAFAVSPSREPSLLAL